MISHQTQFTIRIRQIDIDLFYIKFKSIVYEKRNDINARVVMSRLHLPATLKYKL